MNELTGLVMPLLKWYEKNARELPWRTGPTPYKVWVSEIMLQQTRVEAGRDYFLRFMERLPDVEALANVPDEELMKLWEGLGYYNRARNLKKAAGIVMEQYGGEIPGAYEALLALPGVGPYTAGAIGSIAFGLPTPSVDGNVLRVLSRALGSRADVGAVATRKAMEGLVTEALRALDGPSKPGDLNQALMELGALICIPNGEPKCLLCPVAGGCVAFREGTQTELPVKAPKKVRTAEEMTVFVLVAGGRILLRKRPEKGLLAGLWELPNTKGRLSREEAAAFLEEQGFSVKKMEPLPEAKHIFTHREWHMSAWRAEVEAAAESLAVREPPAAYSRDSVPKAPELAWALPEELRDRYPLPSAFSYWLGTGRF